MRSFLNRVVFWSLGAILTFVIIILFVPLKSVQNTKDEVLDSITEYFGGARSEERRHLRRLTMSLDPEIASSSSRLVENICNTPESSSLLERLNEARAFQAAAVIGRAFLDNCDEDVQIGFQVLKAEFWLTRFEAALEISNRFEMQTESSAELSTWRGFILEKMGQHLKAAEDFERSLYLFGDLANVAGSQFNYVTQALSAGGRPCDAIVPLRLYVSLDPAKRDTSETQRLISDLRAKGNCPEDISGRGKAISLRNSGGVYTVEAAVNGAFGTFILDTGASMVMLSEEFARNAAVTTSPKFRTTIVGVTGSRVDFISNANEIAVSDNVARDVPLIVASVPDSFGKGIDGLLGQSYLGRYNIKIEGNRLFLTSR